MVLLLGVRRGIGIKIVVVCNMFDIGGELILGVVSVELIVSKRIYYL